MLDPRTFICNRCGECCIKYTVKLSSADIERIKNKGYKEMDFVEIDKNLPGPNKSVLKKKEDYSCVFLKGKKGDYRCQIYDARPNVCRRYPFLKKNVESCKPVTFSSQKINR